MTQIYQFDQADFLAATQINIDDIQGQVSALPITSATFESLNSDYTSSTQFSVSLVFSGAMSSPDQIILINYINAYVYHSYADKVAYLKDIKDPGTNAGSFVAGSWTTRTLNNLAGDVNWVTLGSNQFTLQPGAYSLVLAAPAVNVMGHQIQLYNVSTSSSVEVGTSSFGSQGIITWSNLSLALQLTSAQVYEVQHHCNMSVLNIGLGRATGFGVNEIYTTVTITKTD